MRKKKTFDSYKAFQFLKRFAFFDLSVVTILGLIGLIKDIRPLKESPIIGFSLWLACWVTISVIREITRDNK